VGVDVAEAFVAAFNTRNLAGLAACLAPDAVARVEGAPFPEERGRDAIRATSLPYMLGDENALRAQTIGHPEASVLLLDQRGRLDIAIRMEVSEGKAISLAYYTMPHCPEVVRRIAAAVGLEVAPAEDE